MKDLKEIREKCLLFSDICGAYELSCMTVENEYLKKREKLFCDSDNELGIVGEELSEIAKGCENEKVQRNECAKNSLAEAKRIVDGISDKHFQRIKYRRLTENSGKTYLPENYETMNYTALKSHMDNACEKLKNAAAELESAFMPDMLSGAIGFVAPSFRKKLHSEIVIRHSDVVRLAAVLDNFSPVKRAVERAEEGEKIIREKILAKALETGKKYKKERDETLAKRHRVFKEVLMADNLKNIFGSGGKYYLGNYHYFSKYLKNVSSSLSGSAKAIDNGGIRFDTYANRLGKHLFVSDDRTNFKNWFISLALDVLENDAKARIRFFDVTGLGGSYSSLVPLFSVSDIAAASTAAEASAFLSETERYISDVNSGKKAVTDTYLFIENIPNNIPEKDADLLLRIIKNGEKCGVRVIGSVQDTEKYPRAFKGFLEDVFKNEDVMHVESCSIKIGEGLLYFAVRDSAENRVKRLMQKLSNFKEKYSVIPIVKHFPAKYDFQKCSSAEGISVPVGIDENGKGVELVFSEKRPYALAVGDVASGKSSVLHALLLGAMARYSPREVRFAVGDLKNGCEFNIYATSGCPYFDSVISSEDKDTMASFLRYYVAEMNNRQYAFDNISKMSGTFVRKYETYRQECERIGAEYLPRTVLVIDEFQTLFDASSSGTAQLLSELVRKGRTYGIHIIMASQRAVSDNLKNSFGSELRNYFTTRIVFKCPVQVARTMLSENCADTGRENSGISKAPLLKCGSAVINTYMGQNEDGTSVVQCFYASSEDITTVLEKLTEGGKKRYVELLNGTYTYLPYEDIVGYITLGKSMHLFCDSTRGGGDVICDDSVVAIDLARLNDSILVCGNTDFAKKTFACAKSAIANAKVNVCNYSGMDLPQHITENANIVNSVSELYADCEEGGVVNLIISPETDTSLYQASSYRETDEVEKFKKFLQSADGKNVINVVFVSDFKAIKKYMPYLSDIMPLRFVSAESAENVRSALGDIDVKTYTKSEGSAIAYYCNKKTGKSGRFFTFSMDI
ncbi:MAG: hypothetical protein IKU61_06450 [Clostridia bacterium]|nr:hypothetical protein [Clostridia bacterium]